MNSEESFITSSGYRFWLDEQEEWIKEDGDYTRILLGTYTLDFENTEYGPTFSLEDLQEMTELLTERNKK